MLAGWALQVSDRLFLGQHVTDTEMGYYAIRQQGGQSGRRAMTPIYLAWTPLALAVQNQNGATERYVNMSRYLVVAVFMAGLAVGLFATEILIVLTTSCLSTRRPLRGLSGVRLYLQWVRCCVLHGAMIGKQLASVSGAVDDGAVINVLAEYGLVPRFGMAVPPVDGDRLCDTPNHPLLVLQKRFPFLIPWSILGSAFRRSCLGGGRVIRASHLFSAAAWRSSLFCLPCSLISLLWLQMITPFEATQIRLFLRHRIQMVTRRCRQRRRDT